MRSHQNATSRPAMIRTCWALAFMAALVFACFCAAADPAATLELSSSDVSTRHFERPLKAQVPTRAGLQLIVRADCANVQIFTDGSDSVSYALRPDPAESPRAAPNSLQDFALTARQHSARCHAHRSNTSRARLPRRSNSTIFTCPTATTSMSPLQSGNIITQDIDGVVVFSTGGGEIRAGKYRQRTSQPPKLPANGDSQPDSRPRAATFTWETLQGPCVPRHGGGQISAGDVHGPAVLRTGGGDIRVVTFSGRHALPVAAANITAEKVDGGVWADTAGGHVEIGDPARLAAAVPTSPLTLGIDTSSNWRDRPC